MSDPTTSSTTEETSKTYEAGCHCGDVRFSVTLKPSLETRKVTNCNCSICRRKGYLLVYPTYEDVTWHDGSKERIGKYEFNTKTRDHMFCTKCGCSLGIDFYNETPKGYGVSIRTFDGIDLDEIHYKKLDGINKLKPAGDLSGGRQA